MHRIEHYPHTIRLAMKSFQYTILLFVTAVTVLAGDKNASVGTSLETKVVDGKVLQQFTTFPERVPAPLLSTIDREQSILIPNSGMVSSNVKWVSSDPTAIGNDVVMSPTGSFVMIGWNLNSPRVSFHNDVSNVPLWEYFSNPNVFRNFVAMSANANIIANASYQNIYLFDKNTGNVTFNFAIPDGRIAGPVAVSRDGMLLVCATSSPLAGGMHRVYAFSPPSTTPLWTFDFSDAQSTGIYGITISVDKSTVAVNGKFYGWVLNANNGTVRTEMEIANTESRLALSANASVMAIAELSGFIKAFVWDSTANRYNLIWQYRIPAGLFTNWASSIDVSADGFTIMAGSLIFVSSSEANGSVYLFDTFGEGTPNWIYQGTGDMVDEIALADDGSIGAVATWGDLAHSMPDILIFERNSNTPVFTVNTPGSMFSVSISADGRSVVAGGKAVHARQFGNGGNVYNIGVDLGGGCISGTVTLSGATNHAGALVGVVGTNRTAATDSLGRYVVSNVPAGTHSVRVSKLGYVATTLSGINVVQGDTTSNVNAALTQTGAPPTSLVASHSLNSYIQLNWTNPTSAAQRMYDRLLAADEVIMRGSTTALNRHRNHTTPLLPLSVDVIVPDSIRVYRAIRSGGPYYLKRTLPGSVSTFRDSLVLPLKDYYYRVTAVYGNGESIYSNEAHGTVDSSFLQFSITAPHRAVTPTIDGVLASGEWNDALRIDVSDVFGNGGGVNLPRGSVFMYFKYDSASGRLYIAGEDYLNTDGLANGEGFGLYFDDNHNRRFEASNINPLLREGNYWAYYFTTGPTVRFREIYSNGGVNAIVDTVFDAQTAMSSAAGHFTGEVSIPIGFFNKNHLQVYGPDKIVGAGLFIISRTTGGTAVFHGWWPQTMTSVFSPSGFGDVRIPITLLAPPQAPGDVTVVREENRLRVTWTDPTHGINNELLTVPVTLELYKNNALLSTFAAGVESFLDSNVVSEGWYEYKLRGSIHVSGTDYFGPYSPTVGAFAVNDPSLSEIIYDDGIPEVFYVVDFTYDGNRFGIRYTPENYPAKIYRVKAFTNNGNSPILVSVHEDSLGLPGAMLAGPYIGESYQTAGVDSFVVTIPGTDPPTIANGNFFVVLGYLPGSPGAPGIGGDFTPPVDQRSFYFTTTTGWVQMTSADLIVRAFVSQPPLGVGRDENIPTVFALHQNYPNPFNPSTVIRYSVPVASRVMLEVYNILGQEVATLVDGVVGPGNYTVNFDATGLTSGVYFYRLRAGNFLETRKLVLLR